MVLKEENKTYKDLFIQQYRTAIFYVYSSFRHDKYFMKCLDLALSVSLIIFSQNSFLHICDLYMNISFEKDSDHKG